MYGSEGRPTVALKFVGSTSKISNEKIISASPDILELNPGPYSTFRAYSECDNLQEIVTYIFQFVDCISVCEVTNSEVHT